MAAAIRSSSGPASGFSDRGAGREQHLGLEHEPVADHADIRAVAEDLAEAAEEVGPVAGEFLDLLRQRDVQPASELGDARLGFPVAALGGRERILQGGELAAHGADLLVQQVDLGQRPLGGAALRLELLVERAPPRPGSRWRPRPGTWLDRARSRRRPASCGGWRASSSWLRRFDRSRASRSVRSAIWRLSLARVSSRPGQFLRQEELRPPRTP